MLQSLRLFAGSSRGKRIAFSSNCTIERARTNEVPVFVHDRLKEIACFAFLEMIL
jgi:hypothetical protein